MKFIKKWVIDIIVISTILIGAGNYFLPTNAIPKEVVYITKENPNIQLMEEMLPGYKSGNPVFSMKVEVSSYNPVKEQCDTTPLINSSNKLVCPGQLAIPQQFRKKIGISLGQTVVLGNYGIFTVTDHMAERYKDSAVVDIISFIPKWSKKFGRKHGIMMYWW